MHKVVQGIRVQFDPVHAECVLVDEAIYLAIKLNRKTGSTFSVFDDLKVRGWAANGRWCWCVQCTPCNGTGVDAWNQCKICFGHGVVEDRSLF